MQTIVHLEMIANASIVYLVKIRRLHSRVCFGYDCLWHVDGMLRSRILHNSHFWFRQRQPGTKLQ